MSSMIMSLLMTWPIEPTLGYLMSNKRGRDAGLFTRSAPIFTGTDNPPPQSITVTSPTCGESGGMLAKEYGSSQIGGQDRIPSLSWSVSAPADKASIKEWLLVTEDPDAPTAEPIVHGIYYGIPAERMSVTHADFERFDATSKKLKGGFFFGQNRRGTVYIPPRPIAKHGPHRYFFAVVGLSEKLDVDKMTKEAGEQGVNKETMLKAIEGTVVGWGEWFGSYENK